MPATVNERIRNSAKSTTGTGCRTERSTNATNSTTAAPTVASTAVDPHPQA
ncbi:hypothetical protein [Saccharopolyspora pogona]|uniref:hypothetical protein n=1 Tax=Saccharopolyspora pogona TaxID=333966 RepID=UPI0016841DBF|nr:hypothetical protein [Saccharopolyspora pogona]